MRLLILFVGWCILLVLYWPLALLALILFPIVWLISLPLRLIGITLSAVFAFLRALLFLPARLLGYRAAKSQVYPVSPAAVSSRKTFATSVRPGCVRQSRTIP